MEWRCEWCGKPHESDDPPCDNCGHGTFERAVVRQSSSGEAGSTIVWVCTACGREHTKHSPPCSRCNNATLERQEKTISDDELTQRPGEARTQRGPAMETTTVWTCAECGREHARHAATCNNCGSPDLEETEKQISESETAVPSYLDLVTPQYALALGAVLLVAAVAILGFAGVIDVPFISSGVPDVQNVPGSADETESGVALADVESEFVTRLNDRRESENVGALDRPTRLDEIAEFTNQQRVKGDLGDGSGVNQQRVDELVRGSCQSGWSIHRTAPVVDGDDASSLAEKLAADGVLADPLVVDPALDVVGVDVHAAGGELYLQVFFCTT